MIVINSGERTVYHPLHPELKLVDPKLTLEDNGAGCLTFGVYGDNPNQGSIRRLFPLLTVVRDGRVIFKGRVIKEGRDFHNRRTVEAEGKLAFFNDSYLEPFSFRGSPRELFRMIVENHNARVLPWQQFRVGAVTVKDNNDYIVRSSAGITDSWSALKEKCFQSGLGGHIRIRYEDDGDYVDWLEDYGKVSPQGIEFARNIISLSMETDATETYTAMRPVGAEVEGVRIDVSSVNGGKTWIVNEERARDCGIIFAPEEESTWEDVTLPENLLRKAREKLCGPLGALSETYEVHAVDLHLTDPEIEALDICEYVPVSSRPHGISGNYLLDKADIFIASPQDSVYYLGASRRVLSDMEPRGPGPQKISALENDAGYISEEKAGEMLEEYPRTAEVEDIVGRAVAGIPAGEDGASAYAVAVRNGYAGTEEEWLAALKGERGEEGKAATIRIGTVTTGEPGTRAGVENVGTEYAAVLDITIPRGEPGRPGTSGGGAGQYAFEIREDGHLWLVSDTEQAAERFYVNGDGHLIYVVGGRE